MPTVTKTIRLPADIVSRAEREATQLGLTFNDYVEMVMAKHLGLPGNKDFDVLSGVRDYLLGTYPDRRGFSQDVTLSVFRHIRKDESLWKLYVAATTDDEGKLDELARDSLHRRIGKAVKSVLGARVVGRSLPLDPAQELIRSHALLEPDTHGKGNTP